MGHRHRAVGFLGARILVRDHGEQVENSSWNAVRAGMSRALCIGKKEERGTYARRREEILGVERQREYRIFRFLSLSRVSIDLSPFGLYRFFSSVSWSCISI